jgi:hypothetical protein
MGFPGKSIDAQFQVKLTANQTDQRIHHNVEHWNPIYPGDNLKIHFASPYPPSSPHVTPTE